MLRSNVFNQLDGESVLYMIPGFCGWITAGIASCAGAGPLPTLGFGVGACATSSIAAYSITMFGKNCRPERSSLDVNSENENTPLTIGGQV